MCDLLDALASTGIRMPAAGGMPECVWHNPNRRAALRHTYSSADISVPMQPAAPGLCFWDWAGFTPCQTKVPENQTGRLQCSAWQPALLEWCCISARF